MLQETDCRWGKRGSRDDLAKTAVFQGLFPNNMCLRPFTSDHLENRFSSYRISSSFLVCVFCLVCDFFVCLVFF